MKLIDNRRMVYKFRRRPYLKNYLFEDMYKRMCYKHDIITFYNYRTVRWFPFDVYQGQANALNSGTGYEAIR